MSTPTPPSALSAEELYLAIGHGEGSADMRIVRGQAEMVEWLWEQCGHDWTGDEAHARNNWFTYLEDGDNWQHMDGIGRWRCKIEVGETGHIEFQRLHDGVAETLSRLATPSRMEGERMVSLLEGLQEVTFEGCGYCLISPEDRDEVVAALASRLATQSAGWIPWKPGDAMPPAGKYWTTWFGKLTNNPYVQQIDVSAWRDDIAAYWSEPCVTPAPYTPNTANVSEDV